MEGYTLVTSLHQLNFKMPQEPPDPLYTLKGNMASILCLMFRKKEDLELLYVGTTEGLVHIWDLSNFRELTRIQASKNGCLSILNSEDTFITQEKGGGITTWREVELSWTQLSSVPLDYAGFCKISFFQNTLFCPQQDSKILIQPIDGSPGLDKGPPSDKAGQIMCLKILPDSILAAFEAGDLVQWALAGGEIQRRKITSECPMCFDVNPETREGVLGTSGEHLVKFWLDKEETITRELTNPGVASVAIHPEGKLVAAGCWDGRVRYFSLKKLTLLAVLSHHSGVVENVLYSRDRLKCSGGYLLAAGGSDGRVSLWNLYEQR